MKCNVLAPIISIDSFIRYSMLRCMYSIFYSVIVYVLLLPLTNQKYEMCTECFAVRKVYHALCLYDLCAS